MSIIASSLELTWGRQLRALDQKGPPSPSRRSPEPPYRDLGRSLRGYRTSPPVSLTLEYFLRRGVGSAGRYKVQRFIFTLICPDEVLLC